MHSNLLAGKKMIAILTIMQKLGLRAFVSSLLPNDKKMVSKFFSVYEIRCRPYFLVNFVCGGAALIAGMASFREKKLQMKLDEERKREEKGRERKKEEEGKETKIKYKRMIMDLFYRQMFLRWNNVFKGN